MRCVPLSQYKTCTRTTSQYKTCKRTTVTVQNTYAYHCHNIKHVRVPLHNTKHVRVPLHNTKHVSVPLSQYKIRTRTTVTIKKHVRLPLGIAN
jgi:hypothetical protein